MVLVISTLNKDIRKINNTINNGEKQKVKYLSALTLFLAGSKRFSLWLGGVFKKPRSDLKTTLLSEKRQIALHRPRRDLKLLKRHFRVRLILRSPEVIECQIRRK